MKEKMRKALEAAWDAGWDAGETYTAAGSEGWGPSAGRNMLENARDTNPYTVKMRTAYFVYSFGEVVELDNFTEAGAAACAEIWRGSIVFKQEVVDDG